MAEVNLDDGIEASILQLYTYVYVVCLRLGKQVNNLTEFLDIGIFSQCKF